MIEKRGKYRTETKVMDILRKEGQATIPRLQQCLNHKSQSTVRTIIDRHLGNKIGVKEIEDSKGMTKKIYFLLKEENVADDDTIVLIEENLKSNMSEKIKVAIKDLEELCQTKKIVQSDFLSFMIDIIKNPQAPLHKEYRDKLIRILYHTLMLLTKDKNEDLVEKITTSCVKDFEKIALNESEKIKIRNISLNILILLDDPERLDISFQIIEKATNENYEQLNLVESIVYNSAMMKPVNIRKRLYDLISPDKDESVRDRALRLLEKTRPTFTGMEHRIIYS